MQRNSLDQVLIKGAPLETRDGKRRRRVSILPADFEFGQRQRTQAGIDTFTTPREPPPRGPSLRARPIRRDLTTYALDVSYRLRFESPMRDSPR